MANFCTKCGTALNPGTQFCTACGSPVGAAGASAANTPMIGQPPITAASPVSAPPPAGNNTVKIILIVVAVCVGLGIIGVSVFAYTAWRFARSIHVTGSDSDGKVTVDTGNGSISASQGQTFTASDLGVDIYPGAQSGHGSLKMDLPTGSMITGVFVTSDAKDKVVAFYKDKLGSEATVFDSGNGAMLTLNKGQHESVMVTISGNSSQDDGKTRISIVHTKSNK